MQQKLSYHNRQAISYSYQTTRPKFKILALLQLQITTWCLLGVVVSLEAILRFLLKQLDQVLCPNRVQGQVWRLQEVVRLKKTHGNQIWERLKRWERMMRVIKWVKRGLKMSKQVIHSLWGLSMVGFRMLYFRVKYQKMTARTSLTWFQGWTRTT